MYVRIYIRYDFFFRFFHASSGVITAHGKTRTAYTAGSVFVDGAFGKTRSSSKCLCIFWQHQQQRQPRSAGHYAHVIRTKTVRILEYYSIISQFRKIAKTIELFDFLVAENSRETPHGARV